MVKAIFVLQIDLKINLSIYPLREWSTKQIGKKLTLYFFFFLFKLIINSFFFYSVLHSLYQLTVCVCNFFLRKEISEKADNKILAKLTIVEDLVEPI